MKNTSFSPFVALIGSLLIGTPQGFAQNLADSNLSEPARFTVAPHTSSRIAMKALPKATCILHVDGDSDTSHSFKLFSDDEGMIRFNVNPREESDEVAAFAVDCTSDGQSRRFGLELRANQSPSLDMPAPAAEIRAPKASDVVRPALTEAEALELSDDELAAREYPVRPNPTQAPSAFAKWLRVVTNPARRVDARQVANPELRASTVADTSNWSGFDLKHAPNEVPVSTYNVVYGEWDVPTVTAPVSEGTTYSVLWVGLDGDQGVCPKYCPLNPSTGKHDTPDLWQAGTLQQTKNIFCCFPPNIHLYNISEYYAWTELLPAGMQVLSDFDVLPGDDMFIDVWVGNPTGSPSLSGSDGIALVEDITQGTYTYVYTPRGSEKILGYQAEWIMERPYEGGVLPDLSDYNTAYMYVPFAQQINGDWITYSGALEDGTKPVVSVTSQQLFMYNDSTGNLLSAGYADGSTAIYYEWFNFH